MNNEYKKFLDTYATAVFSFTKKIPSPLKWTTFLINKDRFHSKFLLQFECLYYGTPMAGNLTKPDMLSYFRFFYYLFHSSLLICLCKIKFRNKIKKWSLQYQSQNITLLHSVYYDSSFVNGIYHDPFWENLLVFYKQEKISTLQLVIPVNAKLKTFLCFRDDNQAVIPWFSFNSIFDPFKIAFDIGKEYVNTPSSQGSDESLDLSFLMEKQYRKDLFNIVGIYGLLMAKAVEQIKEKFLINHFVYPYENNCWEKVLLLSLRKNIKNIKITGYQHTVIPLSATNYFLAPNDVETPLPDKILTTGPITSSILKRYGNYPDSCRIFPACATRFKINLDNRPNNKISPIKKILVALHGVNNIVPMLNYLIHQARELKDVDFIFRFHPMVKYELIKNELIEPFGQNNLILSKDMSLKEDFQRSDLVIYSESTVCLEALAIGIPVICFKLTSTRLNYDPIPDLETNKWLIDERSELGKIINEINNISQEKRMQMNLIGQQYTIDYLAPQTEESLALFL